MVYFISPCVVVVNVRHPKVLNEEGTTKGGYYIKVKNPTKHPTKLQITINSPATNMGSCIPSILQFIQDEGEMGG